MRKWLPLVTIALGAFMLLVDVTVVVVALPDMADDLDTSFTSLQWVIDIYALALAGLLLGAGTLATASDGGRYASADSSCSRSRRWRRGWRPGALS